MLEGGLKGGCVKRRLAVGRRYAARIAGKPQDAKKQRMRGGGEPHRLKIVPGAS